MNNLELFENTTLASTEVTFALENGLWLNATAVCKSYSKDMSNYWKSVDTREYVDAIRELSSLDMTELKSTVIGKGKEQGTYIHPSLVVHFARWANPKFAIECDNYIKDAITKTAKIREEALLDYHKEQIEALKAEKRKLNDYDGYITVGKYVKEIDSSISADYACEALKHMNWMYDEVIPTTFRRVMPNTPDYVGKSLIGTKGTPIYTEQSIRHAVGKYTDSLRPKED